MKPSATRAASLAEAGPNPDTYTGDVLVQGLARPRAEGEPGVMPTRYPAAWGTLAAHFHSKRTRHLSPFTCMRRSHLGSHPSRAGRQQTGEHADDIVNLLGQ